MRGDKIFDLMRKVTEGAEVPDAGFEARQEMPRVLYNAIETYYYKNVKHQPINPSDVVKLALDAIEEATIRFEDYYGGQQQATESDASNEPENTVKEEAEGNYGDATVGGSPTEDTMESVLAEDFQGLHENEIVELMKELPESIEEAHIGFDKLKGKLAHKKGVYNPAGLAAAIGRKKYGKEKFNKMAHKESVAEGKKEPDWKDERSHEEAVKQICRDTWKELYPDGKFKDDKVPTRDEIMSEVEFQSKHGLDHRPDASAIRYDAFKKVMKKVKNVEKKLDAEDASTPEEEDTEAKSHYEAPSNFIGMKT